MTTDREKHDAVIAAMQDICARHGYALPVHGSRERDLDLVAVPWQRDISSPETLVDALCEELTLVVDKAGMVEKPHGRVGCILWGRGFPIDLSIVRPMPRVLPAEFAWLIDHPTPEDLREKL